MIERDTSLQAFIVGREERRSVKEIVFQKIVIHGPLTDEKLIELVGLSENTVRPRRIELVKEKKVTAVGTALARSGRPATLWGAQ